jgi:hypothetical protein
LHQAGAALSWHWGTHCCHHALGLAGAADGAHCHHDLMMCRVSVNRCIATHVSCAVQHICGFAAAGSGALDLSSEVAASYP